MPGPARILVADDRIADVAQGYLEGQGHTVDLAAAGEEALASAARLVCTVCGRGYVFAGDQR